MRLISILLIGLAACGGAAASGGGGSTTPSGGGGVSETSVVSVVNQSNYGLYRLHLTPWDHEEWGGDLLGGDSLLPGETQQIAVFACDKYDMRVVDDEGDECVIQDIDICAQNEAWSIDDSILGNCTGMLK